MGTGEMGPGTAGTAGMRWVRRYVRAPGLVAMWALWFAGMVILSGLGGPALLPWMVAPIHQPGRLGGYRILS